MALLLALAMALSFCSCGKKKAAEPAPPETPGQVIEQVPTGQAVSEAGEPSAQGGSGEEADPTDGAEAPDEDGSYDSKEDVALYLWTYGRLPSNYITKKEAEKLGWNGGSLEKYAPGKCIGGSTFGNYEGLLPKGMKYKECDIDTLGEKSRGAKRIVFAEDCSLIYYTGDHYKSFELLYGEEP